MARILVVDDDEAVLGVVERALGMAGHTVVAERSGQRALELLARDQQFDVVVLDIVMAAPDGIRVCEAMRTNPLVAHLPVLFLTAKGAVDDRITGLQAGADDYMSKPFDLRELELRVEALLRYHTETRTDHRVRSGALEIDRDAGSVLVNGQPVELTPIEFDLLDYMLRHVGEVIPSERLLREVWGYPEGIGNTSLVRMHVLNLRRKLEEDPGRPRYVRTVPRHGYVLQPDGPDSLGIQGAPDPEVRQ
ncbi:MAG: response regulator transcription factor [Chloroflexi bacterium]|nr:response regulator transcription factor [Chloroflexota bacterium]